MVRANMVRVAWQWWWHKLWATTLVAVVQSLCRWCRSRGGGDAGLSDPNVANGDKQQDHSPTKPNGGRSSSSSSSSSDDDDNGDANATRYHCQPQMGRHHHAHAPMLPPTLTLACRCGACTVPVKLPQDPRHTTAVDCHCPPCRKFHTAAFASYLVVQDDVSLDDDVPWQSYTHACAQLGTVRRYFCSQCYAKLATQPVDDDDDEEQVTHDDDDDDAIRANSSSSSSSGILYVNMASLVDESIRADYSAVWRTGRIPWQTDNPSTMAPWYPAHPDYDDGAPTDNHTPPGNRVMEHPSPDPESLLPVTKSRSMDNSNNNTPTSCSSSSTTTFPILKGSCACGAARYEITQWIVPNHMPHCYCHVCRHSSGAPFLSWIFCRTSHLVWTTAEPARIRTTSMAFRHVCQQCSGNLTVVYDQDKGQEMWPTVGSIDDDSWRQVRQYIQAQRHDGNGGTAMSETKPRNKDKLAGCADGCLDYVSHIYCKFRPQWYALPNDGLPRWDE